MDKVLYLLVPAVDSAEHHHEDEGHRTMVAATKETTSRPELQRRRSDIDREEMWGWGEQH